MSSSESCSFCGIESSECQCVRKTHYVPCHDRKDFKHDRKYRSVTTYDLDTCLIKYYPRLLKVPSKKYPDIDCAVKCLTTNEGGYVIKLCPGCHILSKNVTDVDYLTIIGDCSPVKGVPYIQGAGCPPATLEFVASHDARMGLGFFNLVHQGKRVTVTGSQYNPCFDTVCPGDIVAFIHRDGRVTRGAVNQACGNVITFNRDPGFRNGRIIDGEGFVILPNVTLKVDGAHQIITQFRLKMVGVVLDAEPRFVAGTLGGYFQLHNSVILDDLHVLGHYVFDQPNSVFGGLSLLPSADGNGFCQGFLGRQAFLFANTSHSEMSWSVVAGAANGVRVRNAATLTVRNSRFFNNIIGLHVVGGDAVVSGALFKNNATAIKAFYFSRILADQSDPRVDFIDAAAVTLLNNHKAIWIGWGTLFHAVRVDWGRRKRANDIDLISDKKVIEDVQAIKGLLGEFTAYQSLAITDVNPVAMPYEEDLLVPPGYVIDRLNLRERVVACPENGDGDCITISERLECRDGIQCNVVPQLNAEEEGREDEVIQAYREAPYIGEPLETMCPGTRPRRNFREDIDTLRNLLTSNQSGLTSNPRLTTAETRI